MSDFTDFARFVTALADNRVDFIIVDGVLLGEIAGGGRYEDLLAHTIEIQAFGVTCRCVTLRTLIALKRAAGRPRDFDAIAELEVLLEEQKRIESEHVQGGTV